MPPCPLRLTQGHLTHPVEEMGDGWLLPAGRGLSATMTVPRSALICRIAPGTDRELMQFGVGEASSRLCNAIFIPDRDEAWTFGAEGLSLEKRAGTLRIRTDGPLRIVVFRDYMKVHRNLPWFSPLDRSSYPRPPTGWCSWYDYYFTITEKETIRNTHWLAKHLKPFGCDVVQIDEGWADNGSGFGANRNFFVTNKKKFPRGMKFLADTIRRAGMTPGIWCCPLGQSDTTLYNSKPGIFLRREDGSSAGELKEPKPGAPFVLEADKISEWGGRYYVDPTGPEGRAYLRRLIRMLCDDWGFDYLKIDGQIFMYWAYIIHRATLKDPSLAHGRAYREAMRILAKAMGPQRFLLNCGEGFASVGHCQGIRTGGDVGHKWAGGVLKAATATARWGWLNTVAFYTDPDVVCVRPLVNRNHAKAWTIHHCLTGQLLMLSDKMYKLPADRVNLLKRILPVADIHPMELYPIDGGSPPALINLKVAQGGVGNWDVVAAYNWNGVETVTHELTTWRFGLPKGDYLWVNEECDGSLIPKRAFHNDVLRLPVKRENCRMISIWPDLGRPQFIGSTRHVTLGATDMQSVRWDAKRLSLRGRCSVVGGHTTVIRIHVPPGFRIKAGTRLPSKGRILRLPIRSSRSNILSWRVDFERAD